MVDINNNLSEEQKLLLKNKLIQVNYKLKNASENHKELEYMLDESFVIDSHILNEALFNEIERDIKSLRNDITSLINS